MPPFLLKRLPNIPGHPVSLMYGRRHHGVRVADPAVPYPVFIALDLHGYGIVRVVR